MTWSWRKSDTVRGRKSLLLMKHRLCPRTASLSFSVHFPPSHVISWGLRSFTLISDALGCWFMNELFSSSSQSRKFLSPDSRPKFFLLQIMLISTICFPSQRQIFSLIPFRHAIGRRHGALAIRLANSISQKRRIYTCLRVKGLPRPSFSWPSRPPWLEGRKVKRP